jgi:HAD superfamily hydrolase (TIGR01484 family)
MRVATASKQAWHLGFSSEAPNSVESWRQTSMRYLALAADYDGTLAKDGRVARRTVDALKRVAASGRKLILVTGRELPQLLEIFPEIGLFDRVVAENGALLYRPATRETEALAQAPPQSLVDELQRCRIEPLAIGRSIVATLQPHAGRVLEAIQQLGLELQVIFNKGAVMVLPANVNKSSGLSAALAELGLSPHNVVAIGDAENDHAMLQLAEYSSRCREPVPTLREQADRTTAKRMAKGS